MFTLLCGRIAQFALMLVTLRVATSLLPPAEMGKIAIVTTLCAMFSALFINPVGMYVNRQLHQWQQAGQVSQYLLYHYMYVAMIAVISAGAVTAASAAGWLNTQLPQTFVTIYIFLTILFNTINQTAIPSLNILGFGILFTVLSNATVLLGLLIAYCLVHVEHPQAQDWLWGVLWGQIILAAVASCVFYQKTQQQVKLAVVHRQDLVTIALGVVVPFAWPLAVSVGLVWCQSQSYRFFLEHALGLVSVGLFVTGYGISAGIMAAIESVMVAYLQPSFYKQISLNDRNHLPRAWFEYAAIIMPCAILSAFALCVLAKPLTALMLAHSFQAASQYLVWGAFVEALRVIANVYGMAAHAEKNTKILIRPSAIGAGISVVLLPRLLSLWGINGMGIALLCAGIAVVLSLHYALIKQKYIQLPSRDIAKAFGAGLMLLSCDYVLRPWLSSIPYATGLQFFWVVIFCLFVAYDWLKKLFLTPVSQSVMIN